LLRGGTRVAGGLAIIDILPHPLTPPDIAITDNLAMGATVTTLSCKLSDGSIGNCMYSSLDPLPAGLALSSNGAVTTTGSPPLGDCLTPSADNCTFRVQASIASGPASPPQILSQAPTTACAYSGTSSCSFSIALTSGSQLIWIGKWCAVAGCASGAVSYPGIASVTSSPSYLGACSSPPGASGSDDANNLELWIHSCAVTGTGTATVTVNFTGTVYYGFLYGIRDVANLGAEEGIGNYVKTHGNAVAVSTTGPTTSDSDYVLSGVAANSCAQLSAGAGQTLLNTDNNFYLAQYSVPAAGPVTASVGCTTSVQMDAVVAAWKAGNTMAAPVPTALSFAPPSPVTVSNALTTTGVISTVSVTTSTGAALPAGNLTLTANAGGRVALSGFNLVPAHNFTSADNGSGLTVTVQAAWNATTITANLTLNVVAAVSSNCPSSPPAEATRAGYTTLAYCFDGAAAAKATASNWLDCSETWANTFEWFYSFNYAHSFCPNFVQKIDPQTGKTVVDFHWNSDTDPNVTGAISQGGLFSMTMGNSGCAWTTNFNCSGAGITIIHPGGSPASGTTGGFPAGKLMEIRFRFAPIMKDNYQAAFPPELFDWAVECDLGDSRCSYGSALYPAGRWFNEDDILEAYGGRDFAPPTAAEHMDNPYGNPGPNNCPQPWPNQQYCGMFLWAYPTSSWVAGQLAPGYSMDTPHNYGLMTTSDGVSQIQNCAYIDHVRITDNPAYSPPYTINCNRVQLNPFAITGTNLSYVLSQRKYLTFWMGSLFGPNSNQCKNDPANCAASTQAAPDLNPGQPDQDYYIEYIAVWSCPGWATDPTCTANGLTQ